MGATTGRGGRPGRGLVDEPRVDVMPILLGAGLPLFAGIGHHRLEKLGVDEVGVRTSLRFRVL
jgi:hypothetical protein